MKKLPIGIQSFEKIRLENYYYVDKTPFVAKLVSEGSFYFLSRPRRFGKSLFLDTLKQAFSGKKELFQRLYLENNWDWSKTYPIIHIDFGEGVVENSDHLKKIIASILSRHSEAENITLREELLERRLIELIEKLRKKYDQKVIVLVDEYDKPILDKIEDAQEAQKNREILKNFYSVLKPLDVHLKFVFLTGVSKFSKVSIFSGLNQLNDISLDRQFATICGYTQNELESVFKDALKGEDLEAIKCWYNGYSFMGEPVYNPFDILLYLQKREFRPFWFESGTPTFLIKLLAEKNFYFPEMEELIASEVLLGSFDVDRIAPENLLFQTGYLTIRTYERSLDGIVYFLGYPNKEVKVSLNKYILGHLTQDQFDVPKMAYQLTTAFKSGKIESFDHILKSLFSSIPYEWYRKNQISNYEGYYASVVYSFLSGAGFDLIAEDYTSKGRIDLTILYEDKAYILEFKVVELEGLTPNAIETLKTRNYHEKYKGKGKGKGKDIYLIGIDFSKDKKNIVGFEWEKV